MEENLKRIKIIGLVSEFQNKATNIKNLIKRYYYIPKELESEGKYQVELLNKKQKEMVMFIK